MTDHYTRDLCNRLYALAAGIPVPPWAYHDSLPDGFAAGASREAAPAVEADSSPRPAGAADRAITEEGQP